MGRFLGVAATCLLVWAVGAPAAAQTFGRNKVHYDRLDFRVLQTPHFDIYYYAEEEEATRHAARMAERWYGRFSRLLGHTFAERQPLVLYASHPQFSQTNLTAGTPSEGTGGFTERVKSRIAMPFAAGLGETDHVLGHEIAHAFQIDIARSVKQDAFTLPGWFIEGMAEYLSLGPSNAHTSMWVHDAARNDALPTLEQLDEPRYFPYRFGHAFWSFLAGQYGDAVLGRVLRSTARGGVVKRLEEVTDHDAVALTEAWHDSIAATEPKAADDTLQPATQDGRGRLHVAPALSPDGRSLMFLSERDRLSLDLYLADVDQGEVVRKIVSTAADPHFDSLQYIHSSGSWDAAGRRFAMAATIAGAPTLVIIDVAGGSERREVRLDSLGEIYNPSWSPDGSRIVLAGLKGGLSDLFIFTVASGTVTQLTADVFADLHPAWSPDGRTIAFATDRFTSNDEAEQYGALRVGLLDVASGIVRPLTPAAAGGPSVKQINPQWAPGGGSVYFISDPDGVSNVYRAAAATGAMRQITRVPGGVSGITATSPALAVAAQAGTLAFSVYEKGRYRIRTLTAVPRGEDAAAPPPAAAASDVAAVDAAPPPGDTPTPLTIAALLADPRDGLPDDVPMTSRPYDDRLRLESVAQPFVGATTGNAFGGVVRAMFGVTFGDFLRDRQLQAAVRVGTDVDDLAAQLAYMNRRGRWNWGVTAGFAPSRFYGARRGLVREGDVMTRETTHLRYTNQWGGFSARYHLNGARRFELGAGVRRTGFTWQTITRVTDLARDEVVSRDLDESPAGRPVYQGEAQAAFVYDTAVNGMTGPVLGQRLRLEVEPALGGLRYTDLRVDARRYFMPVRPLTIAVRVEHIGRLGSGAADYRVTPLVAGLQTRVRGYDLQTFAADECGRGATACSLLDELSARRLTMANVELRAPLVGLLAGDHVYGNVPLDLIAFADAGYLWTGRGAGSEDDRFRSVGAGARANLGGFILEGAAVRTFDRLRQGWSMSILLRPGW